MTSKNPKPTPTTVEPTPDPVSAKLDELAESIALLDSVDDESTDQADSIDEPTEAAAPPAPAVEYVPVDPPAPSGVTVRFLQDYRGVLTGEAYYTQGSVIVFDAERAKQLIEQGRAIEVKVKE